jgi:hypothetical protein
MKCHVYPGRVEDWPSSAKTQSARRINGFRMVRVTTLHAASAIRSPLRSLLLQPVFVVQPANNPYRSDVVAVEDSHPGHSPVTRFTDTCL